MKKPNITKGQWEIVETKNGDLLIVADDLIVCRINELAELTNPNAQAISAVPDMIDALYQVRKTLETVKHYGENDITTGYARADLKTVEKALKKAGVQL